MLWMYQRVIFGKITNPANQSLRDLSGREIAILIPIIFFIVWIGVYPGSFLNLSAGKTKQIVTTYFTPHVGGTTLTSAQNTK
jgi:NADH-quinone oxidoreductase subunit M